ncbi:MAG TPA: type IV pilin-like G/H family protein [Candidatus Obscuribacterales bacterium]
MISGQRKGLIFLSLGLNLFGFFAVNLGINSALSPVILAAQPQNNLAKQLVGKWQVPTNLSSGIIFTEDGKIYIFVTPIEAIQLEYTIDPTFKPGFMLFRDAQGKIVGTAIFELQEDGQLQLDLNITGDEQPAITTFKSQPLLFKKTSEDPRIATSVRIKTPTASELKEQADRDTQLEARQYIEIMNRGNEASYTQYNVFSNNLEEFIKGLPEETRNYRYNIRVIDEKNMVQSVAVAKRDGLKSYIGVVYIESSPISTINTQSIICESDQPTQKVPNQPVLFSNQAVNCPAGYSRVK